MSNTCKYEKYRRWISYDSGITWSPMNEYQKGELIERDSVDCGWEPTPPTPEVEYRWVDIPLADDFYCSGTTKYYKQKMQQSEDSGSTWTDVVPPQYRIGASAESKSSDCGYASRTTSGSPYCDDGNKVVMIYYQVSDDHGASWTTTSSTENIIEYDVAECGYATRTTSGSPYCVGVDKCVDLYHQVTRDGGTTWTTTSTTVSVIEYNSEDCGYVPHDYSEDYLTLRALEDCNFRFINVSGGRLYSLDSGATWNVYQTGDMWWDVVFVPSGQTVMWKGNLRHNICDPSYGQLYTSGAFEAYGNIMSLLYGDDFIGKTYPEPNGDYKFYSLFLNCTNLRSAENLILQANPLPKNYYYHMFYGCTSLTKAPKILPATTLGTGCYEGMFYGCSGLTTAPELPATTLTDSCYYNMFRGCTSLSAITCLATDISANNCTTNWVNGVSSTGTFTKAESMSGWTIDTPNGVPSGWTIADYKTTSGTPYCDGYDKFTNVYHQVSYDGGTTWTTTSTTVSIDYDSVDCGYVPSENYLTLRALVKGKFSLPSNISYSLDSGITWSQLESGSTALLNRGDAIMLKSTTYSGGSISSTATFDVKGNIMSLLYGDDFVGKKSLIGKKNAFRALFRDCANVVSAENLILPATILDSYCYAYMFDGCTSLTTAPTLPATTLAESCYKDMFYRCTSLTTAPTILPATTLANSCYSSMFYYCTSLTTAPQLPATTLEGSCYSGMFWGCTSLTTAPKLPATTLTNYCYSNMFYGCTSLSAVTCLATDISASYCTDDWVGGVAPSGVFTKAASMTGWATGVNGIPSTWNIEEEELNYRILSGTPYCVGYDEYVDVYHQVSDDSGTTWTTTSTTISVVEYDSLNCSDEARYLTFKAVQNGTFSFIPYQYEKAYSSYTLSYSLDSGTTWTELTSGSSTPTVQSGSTIIWKGTMSPTPSGGQWDNYSIGRFTSTGRFGVGGNIMSLLFGDNFIGKTSLSGYNYVFSSILSTSNLIDAENLVLPATTLANGCYGSMFWNCTNLAYPPELPATTLADSCYSSMFSGCRGLNYCPMLPATTLAPYCYNNMFNDCRNIVYSPELLADTLTDYCYNQMFYGCRNLSNVTCTATNLPIYESNATTNWLNGVASSGTFTKDVNATFWTSGSNGIPQNWTIVNV